MNHDEVLIGTIALAVAVGCIVSAFGPWSAPYRLQSISAIEGNFGKPAARATWLLIAIVSATSSLAILSGVRPSFAAPAKSVLPGE